MHGMLLAGHTCAQAMRHCEIDVDVEQELNAARMRHCLRQEETNT